MSGWALVTFYAVLIALSAASYHLFERPLQSLIRGAKFPPFAQPKKLPAGD
jgi:peptidoglycan/LPS O-acetylase OafA/YrhL